MGNGVLEAIFDTSGARSLIDRNTADKLGYKVYVASSKAEHGSYVGPNGKPVKYYGRVKGPIKI